MIVTRIDSLPEAIRKAACKAGRCDGRIIEIDESKLATLIRKTPQDSEQLRGLGDIIASIAQPIAKAIDAVAGTKISTCGGCKKRREKLNKVFPIG